jgi:hypothetical protein
MQVAGTQRDWLPGCCTARRLNENNPGRTARITQISCLEFGDDWLVWPGVSYGQKVRSSNLQARQSHQLVGGPAASPSVSPLPSCYHSPQQPTGRLSRREALRPQSHREPHSTLDQMRRPRCAAYRGCEPFPRECSSAHAHPARSTLTHGVAGVQDRQSHIGRPCHLQSRRLIRQLNSASVMARYCDGDVGEPRRTLRRTIEGFAVSGVCAQLFPRATLVDALR